MPKTIPTGQANAKERYALLMAVRVSGDSVSMLCGSDSDHRFLTGVLSPKYFQAWRQI